MNCSFASPRIVIRWVIIWSFSCKTTKHSLVQSPSKICCFHHKTCVLYQVFTCIWIPGDGVQVQILIQWSAMEGWDRPLWAASWACQCCQPSNTLTVAGFSARLLTSTTHVSLPVFSIWLMLSLSTVTQLKLGHQIPFPSLLLAPPPIQLAAKLFLTQVQPNISIPTVPVQEFSIFLWTRGSLLTHLYAFNLFCPNCSQTRTWPSESLTLKYMLVGVPLLSK